MQVKRYEASNIKDILVKIKRELGPDAIVLSTQQLPGEKGRIEVLAAIDSGFEKKDLARIVSPRAGSGRAFAAENDSLLSLKNEIREIKSLLGQTGRGKIEAALAEIKEGMDAVIDLSGSRIYEKSDVMARIYSELVGRGLSKKSALKLLAEISGAVSPPEGMDFKRGWLKAEEALKRAFVKTRQEEKRVKVFLGPTGVGKTTTLAKLAARYALEQKKSVGLITADTYRIGALEQLKTYAQIIDLPLAVADSREALHRALRRFADKDCILVDTPGRGGDAGSYLLRLKEMFSGEAAPEANMLLSLTASRENMMDVFARFDVFGCDQIIFTKLDECTHFGAIYDISERTGKPISYLTTGQNVPHDIEKANPDRLMELVFQSSYYGGADVLPV
ncbi:MAG: flagellar biosynthesis protein FlhF [Syntrophales bacterium]|jgi:flagellar biosynthesis protein FlhF|nr:flagellar biosynthesis protein FlhF [Syntrophales bacterium]